MILGYARANPTETSTDEQLHRLRAAGAAEIFADENVYPSDVIKPALKRCAQAALPGDEIVVASLDRLAHALPDVLEILALLHGRGIAFRALDEAINIPATPSEQSHLISALTSFGGQTALRRVENKRPLPSPSHLKPGRPSQISDDRWRAVMAMLHADAPIPRAEAARILGISRQALYKRLKSENADYAIR